MIAVSSCLALMSFRLDTHNYNPGFSMVAIMALYQFTNLLHLGRVWQIENNVLPKGIIAVVGMHLSSRLDLSTPADCVLVTFLRAAEFIVKVSWLSWKVTVKSPVFVLLFTYPFLRNVCL